MENKIDKNYKKKYKNKRNWCFNSAEFIDFNQIIKTLCKVQQETNNYFVSIRRHPREEEVHKKSIDIIVKNKSAELDNSNSLIDFIKKCDVVVSTTSTSLFWSVLYNVPIISIVPIYLREFANTLPYLNKSIAIRLENETQLYNTLVKRKNLDKKLINWQKERNKFIKLHASGFDGKACERIYKTLIK